MEREQELAIDRLCTVAGGWAEADSVARDGTVRVWTAGGCRWIVNEDGSVLDKEKNTLHAYNPAAHDFSPPIRNLRSVESDAR